MRIEQPALASIVVFALFVVVGCSQPTSPTGPTDIPSRAASMGIDTSDLAAHSADKKESPFTGSLEGTVTVTPLTPPFASVLIEGTGHATLLGRFTVEIPHQVNQALRTATGTYVFTAANGDMLTAEFSGVATIVSPGIIATTETAIITGGTGRLAGATGSFTGERVFNMMTGTTAGSFEGSISSPGAAKHS